MGIGSFVGGALIGLVIGAYFTAHAVAQALPRFVGDIVGNLVPGAGGIAEELVTEYGITTMDILNVGLYGLGI